MATTVNFQLGGTLKISIDDEPETRPGAFITLHHDGLTLTARGEDMAYKLANDHTVALQVSYVDSKGNPAAVDGEVTWDTSNESIVAVQPVDQDSTMVKLMPGDQLGLAQISATADADLGDGVREIITVMDVEIVAGEAVAGTIAPVGEPEPIGPDPGPQQK